MRMTLALLDSEPHQESRLAAWPSATPGVGRWAAQRVKNLVALQHGSTRSLPKQAV
jgi:hypothetical protein